MIKRVLLLFFGLGFMAAGLLMLAAPMTVAQDATQEATQEAVQETTPEAVQEDEEEAVSDDYCLLCHSKPDQVWHLPSGETLSLTIDPAVIAGSVHGASSETGALACADCHPNFRFPHPVSIARTAREFSIERYAVCRNCHEEQYTRAQDSVHGTFLRAGRSEAAMCVDCHGGHNVQKPNEPRQRISLTCGKCHGAIFEEYQQSVHGSALIDENNADVPTCIDCHGVHDIQNPTTSLFRVRSPELCAKCHADAELMGKYDISTHVFDTYLTEFHGSTVAMFNQEAPDVVTNKAVCYDCHGVHNIQAVKDGEKSPVRETLVETCRECHPNASDEFSDAWLGHYPPTMDTHPGLFVVNSLYDLLTPGVIGILVVVVGSDLFRRIRQLFTGKKGN